MSGAARLMLRDDPTKVAPLDAALPLTIGRDPGNRLCLASSAAVAAHHAVVRFSEEHGWIVCDWESGREGTWLNGRRLERCLPLGDGAEIRLGGRDAPVLVFQLTPQSPPPSPPPPAAAPAPPQTPPLQKPRRQPAAAAPITVGGQRIPLAQIRSAEVRSRPRFPHSFSWWLLVCLGGLVLLSWPWLFWPLQIGALAAWILLGSRKEHELIVTLDDGRAHRHGFANRITALGHRNGIRKAIGQELEGR